MIIAAGAVSLQIIGPLTALYEDTESVNGTAWLIISSGGRHGLSGRAAWRARVRSGCGFRSGRLARNSSLLVSASGLA